MSQHILMMGLNHATAPVQVREQVACARDELADILPQLVSSEPTTPFTESVILSTCNRTEIYAVTDDLARGEEHLRDFFESRRDLVAVPLDDCIYTRRDRAAVDHLLSVASGLDSMVLGEFEILGQVRTAYELADQHHALGPILTALFHSAIHTGKRARSETAIGHGATSVAYAAIEMARHKIGDLNDRCVLIIGTGEMGQRVAKNLNADGVCTLLITSRTTSHAAEIANDLGGQVIAFSELPAALSQADLAISATGAPHIILNADAIRNAMATRPQVPLCLIDLAVPRDIDPAAAQIPNVHLFDLDALQATARENIAERESQVAHVQEIIAHEADAFWKWHMDRRAAPIIAGLRERAEAIREAELEKALRRLGHLNLNDRDRNVIAALSAGIISKLLAAPTVHLKERVESGDGQVYLDTLRELFDLSDVSSVIASPERAKQSPIQSGIASSPLHGSSQ